MDISTLTTLIGSFGFPIVACICMAWYVKYQMDENNRQLSEIRNEHKAEMNKVTTALNNNTVAINTLCERLVNVNVEQ